MTPTCDVPAAKGQAKEDKLEVAGAFEDAAHVTASKYKKKPSKGRSGTSDSHDRPHEVIKGRNSGVRANRKAGLLADTSLTVKTVIDFDPRPASVVIEETIGMPPAAIDALADQTTAERFSKRPDLIREPWAGYVPAPEGTTSGK